MMSDWNRKLRDEFEQAREARAKGKEARARVCARRAAGIAIREYYRRRGQIYPTPSAYDLLQILKADPALPPEIHNIANHLTIRVTEDFELPVDVDLLIEAKNLCQELLPEMSI